MLRTADEARSCWCPMAPRPADPSRIATPDEGAAWARGSWAAGCIGDACMLWRWERRRFQDGGAVVGEYRARQDATLYQAELPRRGWCGLGHQPEA